MSISPADESKQAVWREIDRRKDELEDLARTIHDNPEVKFEERKARDWLCDLLAWSGFRVEKGVGGLETAFRAEFAGSEKGPRIGFLAEYDALPGIGHACGHNLIGPSSLGAALGLAGALPELSGSLVVVGTPGEEGGGGKVFLAEADVFQDLDAAMMVHPSGGNILWKRSLARRKLEIEFFGRSAHAASYPDRGINALDAVIQTFNAINALRQQMEDSSRIHGIISHGGESPNVIPDYSRALFYVRAMEDQACDDLLERVMECARGAAAATGCSVDMSMTGAYRALKVNLPLAEAFAANGNNLGIEFEEVEPDKRLGSTDMGDVSQRIPAIHPYLNIAQDGQDLVGHTHEFREAACSEAGIQAMILAAKAMAGTAVDILMDPDLRVRIQEAFVRR